MRPIMYVVVFAIGIVLVSEIVVSGPAATEVGGIQHPSGTG